MVNNARRVLGVDAASVLAVSARSALGAKLAAAGGGGGFFAGLWGAPAFGLLYWPMGRASGAGLHSCCYKGFKLEPCASQALSGRSVSIHFDLVLSAPHASAGQTEAFAQDSHCTSSRALALAEGAPPAVRSQAATGTTGRRPQRPPPTRSGWRRTPGGAPAGSRSWSASWWTSWSAAAGRRRA